MTLREDTNVFVFLTWCVTEVWSFLPQNQSHNGIAAFIVGTWLEWLCFSACVKVCILVLPQTSLCFIFLFISFIPMSIQSLLLASLSFNLTLC